MVNIYKCYLCLNGQAVYILPDFMVVTLGLFRDVSSFRRLLKPGGLWFMRTQGEGIQLFSTFGQLQLPLIYPVVFTCYTMMRRTDTKEVVSP